MFLTRSFCYCFMHFWRFWSNVKTCIDTYFSTYFQALDRGEKLDVLADKTEDLRSQVINPLYSIAFYSIMFLSTDRWVIFQAQSFKKQGTQIRRKMWLQNMKIKLVVLGVLLLLVLIVWVSVCQGFDCTKWLFLITVVKHPMSMTYSTNFIGKVEIDKQECQFLWCALCGFWPVGIGDFLRERVQV